MILLRLGEITLKSRRTRRVYEKILVKNIADAFKSCGIQKYRVFKEKNRFFIDTESRKAVDVLKRVFGLTSLSIVERTEFNSLEELIEKCMDIFGEKIRGRKFAVRARRIGSHSFTSLDIERKLGEKLKPYGEVNLSNPEVTVNIEVRDNLAYMFTEKISGAGGLPIGSNGKILSLISGGFDSAVAAWFMLKRGAVIHYLFCNLGGCAHEEGALKVVKVLVDKWSYGYNPKIYMVDFKTVLEELRRKVNQSYWNVVLKRVMYRVAEEIAKRIGAEGIVTGESLGQVSSQTLRNLYVASKAVDTPVFRPLIGFDKEEIMGIAREIETYEPSAQVKEYCNIVPRKPKTAADLSKVIEEEGKMDGLIMDKILETLRVINLKELKKKPETLNLEIDYIPDESVIVDLRDKEKFSDWHFQGALNVSPSMIMKDSWPLNPEKTYVFYCEKGVVSIEVAAYLRSRGFKAYSFRGGVIKLRKIVDKARD